MAVSREWEEFVLEQLSGVGRVRSRRMFGGVGLWLDETFFGLVVGSAGDVYFKVDDGNRHAYEAAGSGPFKPFADKAYAMSFWRVPAEVIDDPDEMAAWARDAVAAARRGASAPARKKVPAKKNPRVAIASVTKKPRVATASARTPKTPARTPRTPRPKRG